MTKILLTSFINYPGYITSAIYSTIKLNVHFFELLWKMLVLVFSTAALLSTFSFTERFKKMGDQNRVLKVLFSSNVFIVIILLQVIILRIPNLILTQQNVDENLWIANAATFFNGGEVLWKTVAGATGGPLIFVPLYITHLLGDGLNFTSIRIFGLLFCIIPTVYLVWKTLSEVCDPLTARIFTLFIAQFFALANSYDMIAYNGEYSVMPLITIGIYLFFSMQSSERRYLLKLILLGFFTGLIPYAKLQAVPIGITIGFLAFLEVVFAKEKSVKQRVLFGTALIISAITPSIITAVYLIRNDAFPSFFDNYIFSNLNYVQNGLGPETHVTGVLKYFVIFRMVHGTWDSIIYFFLPISFVFAVFVLNYGQRIYNRAFANKKIVYSAIILFAAYISVTVPGNPFQHYILLFNIPFTLLLAFLVARVFEVNNKPIGKSRALIVFGLLIAFRVLLVLVSFSEGNLGFHFVAIGRDYDINKLSVAVSKYTRPNDRISIWGQGGSGDKLFVETKTRFATNYLNAFWAMVYPQTDTARVATYVRELKKNMPIVFVDKTRSNVLYADTSVFGHEHFEAVNRFVTANYTLTDIVNDNRVYVLNSRLIMLGIPTH